VPNSCCAAASCSSCRSTIKSKHLLPRDIRSMIRFGHRNYNSTWWTSWLASCSVQWTEDLAAPNCQAAQLCNIIGRKLRFPVNNSCLTLSCWERCVHNYLASWQLEHCARRLTCGWSAANQLMQSSEKVRDTTDERERGKDEQIEKNRIILFKCICCFSALCQKSVSIVNYSCLSKRTIFCFEAFVASPLVHQINRSMD
jgi:hypothetical protein